MAARFCGRCGAPNTARAAFCGNCGAPLAAAAPVAMAGAAAVPVAAVPAGVYPQQYRYAYAPGAPARARLSPLVLGGVILAVFVIAVIVISIIAVSLTGGTFKSCTSNCRPPRVTPLPDDNAYVSRAFRYQVGYPNTWSIQDQDDAGVIFSTRLRGAFVVHGQKAAKSNDALIQDAIAGLPSSQWQNVQVVAPLHGAHVGVQDGAGMIYSANLTPANGQAQKVRIAVVAATRGGVSVVTMGINPADTARAPNGIPEASAFDYVLSEFTWP